MKFTLDGLGAYHHTPSIGGVSHHWTEDRKEEDLALALRIRAGATAQALSA